MAFTRLCGGATAIQNRLRESGFGLQDRPFENTAVPLDERRNGAAALDDDFEQLPHGIRDRAVMAVDQQQIALVIALLRVSGEVNLADARQRKIGEIVER